MVQITVQFPITIGYNNKKESKRKWREKNGVVPTYISAKRFSRILKYLRNTQTSQTGDKKIARILNNELVYFLKIPMKCMTMASFRSETESTGDEILRCEIEYSKTI